MSEEALSRKAYLVPFMLLLVNAGLKLPYLASGDIAMDEPFSIFHAQMPPGDIWAMLKSENNPPLHFFLLHYWIKVAGIGPFAVRLPSLIFSTLTVLAVFYSGKKIHSAFAGLTAALFFTLSEMHLYFAHEARAYSLFVFLTACLILVLSKIMKKEGGRIQFLWLGILAGLLLYTHYVSFFMLGGCALTILLVPGLRKQLKFFLLSAATAIILYIPNIYILISRLGAASDGSWVHKPVFSELYGNINRFFNSYVVILLIGLAVLTGLAGIFRSEQIFSRLKKITESVSFPALLFICSYLPMFAVSFVYPVFLDRYLLYTSIPLFLATAILLSSLYRPKALAFAMILLSAAMLTQLSPRTDNKRRVKHLVEMTNALRENKSPVIINPEYSALEFCYHYNTDFFKNYRETYSLLRADGIFPARYPEHLDGLLTSEATKIIYIDCGVNFAFGSDSLFGWLHSKYRLADRFRVYSVYQISIFREKEKPRRKAIIS